MHQVIAPAIELEARGRRAVRKFEERVIQPVVLWQFLQRAFAENRSHLRFERGGEQAIDVVIAVVHEHEPAIAHVAFEIAPLGRIELHQLVPGQVAERRLQHARIGQGDHMFLRVHTQLRVIDQRGDQVGRHARIHVPVTGVVAQTCKPEIVVARRARAQRQRQGGDATEQQAEHVAPRNGSRETAKGGRRRARLQGIRLQRAASALRFPNPHSRFPAPTHTASDNEVNVKSRSRIGGIIIT